jgi:hypothetical protein
MLGRRATRREEMHDLFAMPARERQSDPRTQAVPEEREGPIEERSKRFAQVIDERRQIGERRR